MPIMQKSIFVKNLTYSESLQTLLIILIPIHVILNYVSYLYFIYSILYLKFL